MAAGHSILPFPADINREQFGHWLSGFTDGEGCFLLKIFRAKRKNKTYEMPGARFEVLLRQDDLAILQQIQSFLGVGCIGLKRKHKTSKGGAVFYVSSAPDHAGVLVPHFERFPLRAKKSRDFDIWKKGVLLLHLVQQRPVPGKPGGGTLPKWSDAERAEFWRLAALLKEQRLFQPQ